MNDTSNLDARIDELMQRLTLEEKATLTVGRDFWTTNPIDRLGIPSIWMSDGPTGLRKAPTSSEVGIGNSVPATCFPTESALSASWDTDLIYEVAGAMAREAQAEDVQILLAPGVNLKRSPLGGRNFEYFSEDPFLSGELAAAFINGLQDQGVGASLKHYAANENETGRMYADSIVDERTLRELYLRPFEIAVDKSQPWTIMSAYNRLNGVYCSEDPFLLERVSKDEWGFEGIFVSDWGAVNDRVEGIRAGLHLQMPGAPTAGSIVEAVQAGRLNEGRLDELVRELLRVILRADASRRPGATWDRDEHNALARRAAAESMVLLKNEGGLLPLDGHGQIAIIGRFAKSPRFQGGGSSEVVPTGVENAYDELAQLLPEGSELIYAEGYGESDQPDQGLLEQVRHVAQQAGVAVVFVGLPASYETEGRDRTHMDLPPAHNALVEAVLAVQPRTAVVLVNGTAVTMPWASRAPAVLESWLGGQASGGAVTDVLLGKVNPSGKLAETFPMRLSDTPSYLSFPGDGDGRTYFTERMFTGYRWYDARGIEPLYPFGHGLSYTTFEYRGLQIRKEEAGLTVSVKVRNTGKRAGKEVVQLYVREQQPRMRRPDKELRAFAKVRLEPGEEQKVTMRLTEHDFAYYDPRVNGWRTDAGTFGIMIGASSRDIRLMDTVQLEPAESPLPLDQLTPIRDWLARPVGRRLLQPLIEEQARRWGGDMGEIDLDEFFLDMPLAKLVAFGALDEEELSRIVQATNTETSAK